jgi:glutathione S-transferase
MKLYFSPGACSMAVHIALRETKADFELAKVDLATRTLPDGSSYLALAPRGYVPLLELDDGTRHTEAAALLQRIAEQEPSLALIGAVGSARRQQVVEWLVFVATEMHKPFGWLWSKDTADSTRSAVKQKLAQCFAELDRHLATHEHLAGAFSVADAYAFTILGWTRVIGISLQAHPHLQAYLGRIAARPHVQAAMRAEGLMP